MHEKFGPDAIGITSTIPVEAVFAAGKTPVDLNNRFITHPAPRDLVAAAEAQGFPLNFCAWIKGIYGFVRNSGIRRIIGVIQGDCSNTHLLLEILEEEGVEIIPFEYPADRDPDRLEAAIARLAEALGADMAGAEEMRRAMRSLRRKLEKLDGMTWNDGLVTGLENHIWLINSSDMRGDWRRFEAELDEFLEKAAARKPHPHRFRIGFLGIPPIVDDLYEVLQERGAAVVFNEFQRQFAMPGEHDSLAAQYLAYTYPYRTAMRVADIMKETLKRRIDGHVHYVQSFCYRQLQDRQIKRSAGAPVLALEFDRPGGLDGRSLTRIEAFLELLEGRRMRGKSGER